MAASGMTPFGEITPISLFPNVLSGIVYPAREARRMKSTVFKNNRT
jgi:hypothetical protein